MRCEHGYDLIDECPYCKNEHVQVTKNGAPVTTAARSPSFAPGAMYVSEEEYEQLRMSALVSKTLTSKVVASKMKRKWIDMYLDFADRAATESHAERLKVGAIFVSTEGVMSMGINGLPAGGSNVCEDKVIRHVKHHYTSIGELVGMSLSGQATYDLVTKAEVSHAEENLFGKLMRQGVSTKGGFVFLTHEPCIHCAKIMVVAGVSEVHFRTPYTGSNKTGTEWLRKNGILVTGD